MDMKKYFEHSMIDLLKEKCIDQITIQELLRKVGSCKGTFYKYYVDKYDLCNKALTNNVYDKIDFDEQDWEKFLTNYVDTIDRNAKVIMNAFESIDISAPIFQNRRMLTEVLTRILKNQEANVQDEMMIFVLNTCGSILVDIIYTWLKLGRKERKDELVKRIRAITPKSIYEYLY